MNVYIYRACACACVCVCVCMNECLHISYMCMNVHFCVCLLVCLFVCMACMSNARASITDVCLHTSMRFHVQPMAFGVSFNLNLQSQSLWSLFNGTWRKRPRDLETLIID